MKSEWKEMKVGDLCSSISDTYCRNDERVILVNTSNVFEGKILNHQSVENKNLKGQFKKTFKKDDILYSEIRPVNKRYAYVDFENTEKYIASTKLMVLRCNLDRVLPRFLFAFLTSSDTLAELQHLAETRSGTFPQITFSSELASMPILVPSLTMQQKIAGILSSLDDKIELNNRINENLEEQAFTIFKSWFIDYEPFNSAITSNWITAKLGNICTCELGGTPSRAKKEYWNGEIAWINSGEINKFRIIKPTEKITRLGFNKSSTKLLPAKTTVIAITGATLGQVSLLEIPSCANQSVVGIIPNQKLPYEFIYPYIKANIQELISHQTGGAQQHINKQNVENLFILVPPVKIMQDYVDLVSSLYKSIANHCFQNEYLAEIRDTLLPRLMSGELDVSDLDI